MAGRARCPQAGGAGTKAERGHSCPQQRRTEVKLSKVPIPLSIRELLRTRMSALRCHPKNLRALRRLSHIVTQRAASPPLRAGGSAPCRGWEAFGLALAAAFLAATTTASAQPPPAASPDASPPRLWKPVADDVYLQEIGEKITTDKAVTSVAVYS